MMVGVTRRSLEAAFREQFAPDEELSDDVL